MKKYLTLTALIIVALVLSYCGPSKKAMASAAPPKMSFESNLKPVIEAQCSPCHIPSKGGNKLALDNFHNVHNNIDDIVRRIELNPGDKGFMPFRKAAKLSDSTIALFKQWKTDGMMEKTTTP